ncbi:MAG: hypothetical protein HYU99_01205 [Deltaproteobacteria bacterium]|nr:hypothetical protein [Deltaproteobacteria bacterium]
MSRNSRPSNLRDAVPRLFLFSSGGFTFIEVVFIIILLGVAIPGLMQLFVNTVETSATVDAVPVASSLGKDLLEDIMARKFDELDAKDANGNWSTAFGTDTGEDAGDKNDFDDVDDFDGWNQGFGANYVGYSATVSVDYVDPSDLNTALAIPDPAPNDWTPSFKRILVTISNPDLLPSDLTFTTVATEIQSL